MESEEDMPQESFNTMSENMVETPFIAEETIQLSSQVNHVKIPSAIYNFELLKQSLGESLSTISVQAMVDSGAEGVYITESLVKQLQIPIQERSYHIRVNGVAGTVVSTTDAVITLLFGEDQVRLKAAILPIELSPQLVLGNSFIYPQNYNFQTKVFKGSLDIRNRKNGVHQTIELVPQNQAAIEEAVNALAQLDEQLHSVQNESILSDNDPVDTILAKISQFSTTQEFTAFILKTYPKLFDKDLRYRDVDDFIVDLTNELDTTQSVTPVRSTAYSTSPLQAEAIEKFIQSNVAAGLIEENHSPTWSFPLVCIPKQDSYRICIDLRKLNKLLVAIQCVIPSIQDVKKSVAQSSFLSAVDLKNAFHQLKMTPESSEMCTFVSHLGHYKFSVMPFGLRNASSHFQGYLTRLLTGIQGIIVYIDDILVHTSSLKEHFNVLIQVLHRLNAAGLQVNIDKCHILVPELQYLGHVITQDGLKSDPKKVQAVADWPIPRTSTQLRGFLNFANYQRQYMVGYSTLARPLYQLLKGEVPKNAKVVLSHEQLDSFLKIKSLLCATPVLKLFEVDKPVVLITDASQYGIGGVLLQSDSGKLRPVEYESKLMNTTQMNYSAQEREALAVHHCLVKWRHYIEGNANIQVLTDHQSLSLLMNSTGQVNRRLAKFIDTFQHFDITIKYVPGIHNLADPLSRVTIDAQDVPTVIQGAYESYPGLDDTGDLVFPKKFAKPEVELLKFHQEENQRVLAANDDEDVDNEDNQSDAADEAPIAQEANSDEEEDENHILELYRPLEEKLCFSADNLTYVELEAIHSFLMDGDNLPEGLDRLEVIQTFTIDDKGDLFIKQKKTNQLSQVLVEEDFKVKAIEIHQRYGHAKLLPLAAEILKKYWCPNYILVLHEVVRQCHNCQLKVRPSSMGHTLTPLGYVRAFYRFGIDFTGPLATTARGKKHIIVAIDYGTNWATARAVEDVSAAVAIDFVQDLVLQFNLQVKEIVHDNGAAFISEEFQQMLRRVGVTSKKTTPYHARTNGKAEKFNHLLKSILFAKIDGVNVNYADWDIYLQSSLLIYNLRPLDVGVSPFYLAYGVEPEQNRSLEVEHEYNAYIREYTEEEEEDLLAVRIQVMRELNKRREKLNNKKLHQLQGRSNLHEQKAYLKEFEIGDFVLRVRARKHKLEPYYDGPFVVIRIFENHVYELSTINGFKLKNKVNGDRLFPCQTYEGQPVDSLWYSNRRLLMRDRARQARVFDGR